MWAINVWTSDGMCWKALGMGSKAKRMIDDNEVEKAGLPMKTTQVFHKQSMSNSGNAVLFFEMRCRKAI